MKQEKIYEGLQRKLMYEIEQHNMTAYQDGRHVVKKVDEGHFGVDQTIRSVAT